MEYQSPSDAVLYVDLGLVCSLCTCELFGVFDVWYHYSTWEKRIEFMMWIWRTHSHPAFIFHFYVLIPERRVTSTFHEWRHGQFVSICWCWLSTPSNMFRFASVFLHSNPAFQAQSLTKRWQQIWDDRHLGSMKCIFSIAPFSGTDALWPMASLRVLCVEIYSNLWQINLLWMRYPCWHKTNWYSSLKCEFAFPTRLSNSEYSWLQLLYIDPTAQKKDRCPHRSRGRGHCNLNARQCDSQKSRQPRQKGTLMKVHVCCMLMLFTCLSCAAAMFGKFAGASTASTATELQSQHKQALDLLFQCILDISMYFHKSL